MIIKLILISIVSLISPTIALLIAIPFFGKISAENPLVISTNNDPSSLISLFKPLIIFSALQIFLLILNVTTTIQCLEIIVSVGLSATIFAYSLQRFKSYELAILTGIIPAFIYIFLKNLFFFEQIKEAITEANSIALGQMQNAFSPEMLEKLQISLQSFSELMIKGNPSIWLFSILLGVFIGALIFSKKSESIQWDFKHVKFPDQLQFVVIIALLLVVFSFRTIGINLLIFSGFFYLIQGYSVLYFYIQQTLRNNKFIGITLLIIPILNYYLLIALAFTGILDSWVHLRKFSHIKGDKK
ncbi:MAG: DUF2232 domain-containing protein [Candidatus Cloacimonadota bacterium]|nr:DUF2232 domain-containing protein [Candidatus Cloacimonadota bacterium]